MKFEELYPKIEKHYPSLAYKDGKLTCTWRGMLEPMVFDAFLSEDYQDMINICGFSRLNTDFTSYKTNEDGKVELSPQPIKYGDYMILHGITEHKNGRYSVTSADNAVFYEGELIECDYSNVPYYYKDGCHNIDSVVGSYKDCLLYNGNDAIYMISPLGKTAFVAPYDPYQSESGKINAYIDNHTGTLKIDEYVYYDCDHKHGDWETSEYSLLDIIEKYDLLSEEPVIEPSDEEER